MVPDRSRPPGGSAATPRGGGRTASSGIPSTGSAPLRLPGRCPRAPGRVVAKGWLRSCGGSLSPVSAFEGPNLLNTGSRHLSPQRCVTGWSPLQQHRWRSSQGVLVDVCPCASETMDVGPAWEGIGCHSDSSACVTPCGGWERLPRPGLVGGPAWSEGPPHAAGLRSAGSHTVARSQHVQDITLDPCVCVGVCVGCILVQEHVSQARRRADGPAGGAERLPGQGWFGHSCVEPAPREPRKGHRPAGQPRRLRPHAPSGGGKGRRWRRRRLGLCGAIQVLGLE